MRPSSIVQRRPSSRQGEAGTLKQPGGPALLVTTILLGGILATGPLILGAARLWTELPLLTAVAVLLLVQGWRLIGEPFPGVPRQADAIDLSVVLFVLYAIVRWLTSPTEYFSRIEALDVVAYAVVFFTCRYGMANRAYCLALLFLLVALGIFETGFGYYLSQHLNWFPFGSTERLQLYYAPRWLGTYGCPNHYASLLVMAIGAALALGCFSKLAWPIRIVLFYLAGMMLIGVICSGSRGSWLAFVASISALTIFGLRNGTVRWWVPVTGTLALLMALGVVLGLSPDARQRLDDAKKIVQTDALNTYIRVQLAEDALRIAHDHPIFGTGPGTFVFIHPRYQSSTFAFKAVLTHDDYLNCLDDYGLVGFGLAMFFVAAVTLKFLRPLQADQRWRDRAIAAAGFAAWAALLVHSLVDFNLHIPANALLLFALTGLALGRLKEEKSGRHWSTFSLTPLGRWFGGTVIVLGLLDGFQAARTAAGDIAYERAFAVARDVPTDESIRADEAALKYDRGNAQALIFLGDLYRYQASRQQDIEARVAIGQKAIEAYGQALKASSLDDSIPARMGMTFDIMRRYSEAFFCYKTAVTEQPYNGEFWFWLGNHFWERGLLEKAEEAYMRSEQCPHGFEDSAEALKELRALPELRSVPLPASDTNPVAPQPEEEGPGTTP